ncbi:hypothetical protein sos41_03120 [Alphaproteobacteria bacterium SO-S41]|nr:hypothetical protein sos41_03120 [Alphaproteobacteria bacterium SO-S41]
MKIRSLVLVTAAAAALSACASSQIGGGNTVSRDSTRGAAAVEYCVVVDAVGVNIEGTRTGVGAAAGAVAGGAAASQIGGGTTEHVVAGVAGAVVGGLIGDAAEEGLTSQKGIRYTVRLDRGGTKSVTQGADGMVPVGARCQLIYNNDGSATVTRAR